VNGQILTAMVTTVWHL